MATIAAIIAVEGPIISTGREIKEIIGKGFLRVKVEQKNESISLKGDDFIVIMGVNQTYGAIEQGVGFGKLDHITIKISQL
jgi:hypothetical protein